MAKLLGKIECNLASEEDKEMLRFVTPLLKLYTAKQSIAVASEGIEAFGGQGYIEDTGIPNLLRDAQVLSIWEGTTNILSLDVLRSIQKSNGDSLKCFRKHISLNCEKAKLFPLLKDNASKIERLINEIFDLAFLNDSQQFLIHGAREFSFSLYRIFAGK